MPPLTASTPTINTHLPPATPNHPYPYYPYPIQFHLYLCICLHLLFIRVLFFRGHNLAKEVGNPYDVIKSLVYVPLHEDSNISDEVLRCLAKFNFGF